MGELEPKQSSPNVNVTLGSRVTEQRKSAALEFPCLLCGAGLPILVSKAQKPYFVCNHCGVQTFVRGKEGIKRLKEMANSGILISGRRESASYGIKLYNRLEQLKLQKLDLKLKQGIIFVDQNVENAIRIVDAEIEKVEGELAEAVRILEREK